MNEQPKPTMVAYGSLQAAYDFFNAKLFGGTLPQCLVTFQRHAHSYGYYHGSRFQKAFGDDAGYRVDEIAINPQHIAERTPEQILATLVHEMCHQRQGHFGKEPTRCYHDRQWAGYMKEVGLQPSDTGAVGGKETGPRVSHYIIEGGPYDRAVAEFLKGNVTAFYQDMLRATPARKRPPGEPGGAGSEGDAGESEGGGSSEADAKSPGRIKFKCPACGLNAWAKPSAQLICGADSKALEAA